MRRLTTLAAAILAVMTIPIVALGSYSVLHGVAWFGHRCDPGCIIDRGAGSEVILAIGLVLLVLAASQLVVAVGIARQRRWAIMGGVILSGIALAVATWGASSLLHVTSFVADKSGKLLPVYDSSSIRSAAFAVAYAVVFLILLAIARRRQPL